MSNVTEYTDSPGSNNNNHNNKKALETHEVKPTAKKTMIPFSPTPAEYEKLGLTLPYFDDDARRDTKTRLVKGNYKRNVYSIYWVRTDDDKEWLNWHETREGKTSMQRKITFDVPNMGKKKVPIPKEDVQFDVEAEEYKTVITGEKEHRLEYYIPFTQDRLNELLEDINPYKTSYHIKHEGQRSFTISKEEIKSKDFKKVFESHLNRVISEFRPGVSSR